MGPSRLFSRGAAVDFRALMAARLSFPLADHLVVPCDAFVIGEPVSLIGFGYDGNVRRGLSARCRRADGAEYEVAAADVIDVEDQASGTRQIGRRLLACRLAAKIEPGSIGDARQRIRNLEFASCAYRPLISPDPFGPGLVSD